MGIADRRAARLATGTALVALGLLVTGCTEGSAPRAAAPSVAAPTELTASVPTRPDEVAQGALAKARLRQVAPAATDMTEDPGGPTFVESGIARVEEGVRNLSMLKKGAYQVYVSCVGEGAVDVVVGGAPARRVACDERPVGLRVAGAPEELTLDITGVKGASGMVAWELVALSPGGGVRVQ
ncbi:hypothetical protein [Streptomyces sp. NPDC048659]|uniref:hypothetical protein n=1 Tax=Streptomyces sp. NPDC048659 TaxID=3155489 RepID=UPI00342E0295